MSLRRHRQVGERWAEDLRGKYIVQPKNASTGLLWTSVSEVILALPISTADTGNQIQHKLGAVRNSKDPLVGSHQLGDALQRIRDTMQFMWVPDVIVRQDYDIKLGVNFVAIEPGRDIGCTPVAKVRLAVGVDA